jgi:formamidase
MCSAITRSYLLPKCIHHLKTNLKTIEKYLSYVHLTFPHINIVVFPELSSLGIGGDMSKLAQPIPGDLTKIFSTWAKKYKIWLIPGSIYESLNNKIYNSTPVFSPDGSLVGIYRKRFPWTPYEKTEPGKEPFVFEIEGFGKVGIMICYDIMFPEVARDLTHLGAELIIIPTATTTGDRRQEQIVVQATAITQQCYVVSCNGVGLGGVGGSQIIDPEGLILQNSGEGANLQTAIIDFDHVQIIRDKGIAGISSPSKAFKENKQFFSAYGTDKNE